MRQRTMREFTLTRRSLSVLFVVSLGIFVFLPVAVNLFLIQHKASQRYLCGRNHQLFGSVSEQCNET